MDSTNDSSTGRRRRTDMVLLPYDPEMETVINVVKVMAPGRKELTVSREAREALVRLPLGRVLMACDEAFRNAGWAHRGVVLAQDVPSE